MEQYLASFGLDNIVSPPVLAFLRVVVVDLVLSADNGLVVGLAAASLPAKQRRNAIMIGIVLATIFRVAFAGVTVFLLKVPGMLFIGGVLLFYISYKMWRDIRQGEEKVAHTAGKKTSQEKKSFLSALVQIIIADVSMSLDNVLAVAGAAMEHPVIMVFGLGLSILLMATVAGLIANLIKKYPLVGYAGLLVVVYIAASLTYRGLGDIMSMVRPL